MKYRKQWVHLGPVLAATLAGLMGCDGKPDAAAQIRATQALTRRLAEIAGQANQAAPADVDPNTRLEGAKAGPGLRLTTTYTLLNPESEGINSTTFETKLTPTVKEGSCKNTDLRPLIDRGVVVVLEYKGPDGKPMGTISVNRETCSAIK